jgi:hypothetical protein
MSCAAARRPYQSAGSPLLNTLRNGIRKIHADSLGLNALSRNHRLLANDDKVDDLG